MVGIKLPRMANIKAIVPPERRALFDAHGYSAAVCVGNLLFVSGQVGVDDEGMVIRDPTQQIECAFRNLERVLQLGGSSLVQVVDMSIYVVDLALHMERALNIKQRFFPAPPYPALTGVEVAGLAMDGLIFEIKATAVVS